MKLSPRLSSLVPFLSKEDITADIGCDHAYLSIYLVLNNLVTKASISDINEGAINNGLKNITKYHLEDKIKAKLSDGIKDIDEDVNTLIISGMGASTIIKILDSNKVNQINKIITQSNNDHYLLRTEIIKKGYYISGETNIIDNNKYYLNICFKKGTKKYNKLDLLYGPILRKNKENEKYFAYVLKKEKQIYKNIPYYKIKAKINSLIKIKQIKKIIKSI